MIDAYSLDLIDKCTDTYIENTSFEVNAKYFENGVLPPLPEEDEEKYSFKALCEQSDTETLTIFL